MFVAKHKYNEDCVYVEKSLEELAERLYIDANDSAESVAEFDFYVAEPISITRVPMTLVIAAKKKK